ncbi:MAG: efflux RND transporter periplasmic adaptor subunit, partial [Kangiellaceae bacterium]|nr:efflux RND transporter periplasmic adaptor subunit [Kangiellaceae bacterium]
MKSTTIATKESVTQNLLLALVISLSLFTSACSDTGASDDSAKTEETAEGDGKDKKKDEKPPVPVEVVAVSRGDIQQTYRTITTLEADQNAQVVARSTGLLQKIYVEEGEYVEKGQIMAQLDVELLSLEVAQLDATSKKLKKELERQKSLFKRRLASSDALDRAKFEYQSQSAQLKLSKLKLNYASIKAPISGMI